MTSADFRTERNQEDPPLGVSPMLTAAEVSPVLRVGPWRVVQLCQSGELPASKPGKSWLIDPADLRAYLAKHSNQPSDDVAESA